MTRILIVFCALLAFAFPALGADVYNKAPPRYSDAPLLPTWVGAYVGVAAGYAWSNSDVVTGGTNPGGVFAVGTGLVPSVLKTDPHGGIIGLTVGYNWQTGRVVYGVEGDVSWANIDGTDSQTLTTAPLGFAARLSVLASQEISWLATLRGRVGLDGGNWMPYLTAGLAVGGVDTTHTATLATPIPAFNGTAAGVSSDTNWGWTVGAGIEGQLGNGWTAKLEYLYVDLGDVNFVSGVTIGRTPVTFAHNADVTANIVRVGVNYRFWPR